MKLPPKADVHRALRDALAAAHERMLAAARESVAGATHEENRQEGAKDMRATEQSYVARGQAMRAEALAEERARFDALKPVDFGADDRIAAGALVRFESEGEEERVVFVVAQGGGTVLEVDGLRITVVTPSSPVGRALLGKREGDDFELKLRGAKREGYVVGVG